ncbi:hypothetical protein M5689_006565 [Euphorbia peplus]|nr:hypothetical protein M5689_006565 [Euphorbia peplus]
MDKDDEEMLDMLQVRCGVAGPEVLGNDNMDESGNGEEVEEPSKEAARFYRLLEDYKEPLVVDGLKVSKLVYIMKLLHLKCLNHWTNTSFTQLLKFQNANLGCNLPDSYDACRKIISDLGLDYVKIDACPNDCVIYWREHVDAQECPKCHHPRWKTKGKNVPHKILRYFPIKPRLQRLFMSSKTAKEMRWHKEERIDDDEMTHPADLLQWKSFDKEFKSFADDPRNVRLGLAADGFQPFNNFGGSCHSIWPVVLAPYNLPPWMCMKSPYLFLSLLIDGPNSPGMELDVYLQPLIEELKELWEVGAETYDAYSKQNFVMRASLLWTISDFPAYADLSGWSTKGFFACPACHKEPSSRSIKNRIAYLRHRRWLPTNHRWRKLRKAFDKTVEKGTAPIPLSGDDVLMQCSQFTQVPFGKVGKKRKWDEINSLYGWRKKSIFFELPYWSKLIVRHNLDVMHIEKNVSENIIGTLMNIKGKTKDTIKARLDLVKMDIRRDLHPIVDTEKVRIPVACYTLRGDEKSAFCEVIQNLKTPDGYCSNISRCVKDNGRKMSCMKSHDHHVFMEQLLPIVIRGLLPKNVCDPLVELSSFFRNLCSKKLTMKDLDTLEGQIPYTLCKLEMIFPPSFFSVMLHLVTHLVAEAKIAGPVRYRWMYPIERYLRTLKSYVRNKTHPEGSIANGYLADECLTFCSRYMDDMTTKFNHPSRNDDVDKEVSNVSELDIFRSTGRPLGKPIPYHMSSEEFEQAHLYSLRNCDELVELVKEHKEILAAENSSHRSIERRHKAQFAEWVRNRVEHMYKAGSIQNDLYYLVCGPLRTVRCYSGYIVNGFRFHTLDRQENRKTQNSGVMVRGDDDSDKEYYGVLRDVYELQYPGGRHVFVFKCDWYDVQQQGRGYKVDEYGITSVCREQSLATYDPFVLESQVEQVFYVPEPRDTNWLVVIKTEPRDLYKIPKINTDDSAVDQTDVEAVQQETCRGSNIMRTQSELVDDICLATTHFTVEREADVVKWVSKELENIKQQKQEKKKRKKTSNSNSFIVDDDIVV